MASSCRETLLDDYSGTVIGDDNGKPMALKVHGKVTCQVQFAGEVAVGIVAQGSGTVESPFGPQTGEGTEEYALRPSAGAECDAE